MIDRITEHPFCQTRVSGSAIDFPKQLDKDVLAKYGFFNIYDNEFKRYDCVFIVKQETEEMFTIDYKNLSLQLYSEHQLQRAYWTFEGKELQSV